MRPYILRRLKTDKSVIADLPDKTEVRAFCHLTHKQAALYQQSVADLATELERAEGMKRRGVVFASLMRLKQICNHPSQWLGDGSWREVDSGKRCDNLERYSDYANRLPRGRTYVRNGSVVDLQVGPGSVTALVSGSTMYDVKVAVGPVPRSRWSAICTDCSGAIDSLVELLQGRSPRA